MIKLLNLTLKLQVFVRVSSSEILDVSPPWALNTANQSFLRLRALLHFLEIDPLGNRNTGSLVTGVCVGAFLRGNFWWATFAIGALQGILRDCVSPVLPKAEQFEIMTVPVMRSIQRGDGKLMKVCLFGVFGCQLLVLVHQSSLSVNGVQYFASLSIERLAAVKQRADEFVVRIVVPIYDSPFV